MNLAITFENGLREILSHKFRSGLSMLGIVLGVSSLVATLALTTGIERGNRHFFAQMGGLELVQVVTKEISQDMLEFWNLSPGRTLQDAFALRESAPLISHIAPELHDGMPISAGQNTMRIRAIGTWRDYLVVSNLEVAHGRFLADLDEEFAQRVAVIGATIAETLWPGIPARDVIGRTIFLRDVPFEVVGVMPLYEREAERLARERRAASGAEALPDRGGRRRGWDPFRGRNEAVLIPFSTMFYEFRSGAFPDNSAETVPLNELQLRVGDLGAFDAALEQARSVLMTTHRGVDDFGFNTREEWFDNMETSLRATRISGGLIAAISLIVGGIGIANIMLASITERVREIGIRRAVGAKARDIFVQIMIESVTIALMGGLLGLFVGFALVGAITTIAPSEHDPVVTASSIVFSVAFAFVAGVLSGIYPAFQASRLDPIQALRYE